jgi:PAS domain S-box-containing protein
MSAPPQEELRILLLEDVAADAELALHALRRAGVKFTWEHVSTREAYLDALARFAPDVILADYSLPGFDGRAALVAANERLPDVPVIVVSGTLVDETAVELVRMGARDYVLKTNLARLGPAVQRAVADAADVRLRKRTQELLAESELRFRSIVEAAQEGIWMFEAGRTTFMNRRMADMLCLEATGAIGIPVEDLIDIDSREPFARHVERAPGQGTELERIDCVLRGTDEARVLCSIAMSRMPEGSGLEGCWLAMVTDVTAQRRAQEQLMVSDRMSAIGTLAASVAHEINNPLAAMVGNLQLALADAQTVDGGGLEPARVKDLGDELADSVVCAGRIAEIVRDLRVFARAQEAVSGPVDVQEVVESALRLARNELHHRAQVTRDWRPVPMVRGSAARLGQVFLNVIVNAAQSIEAGRAETNRVTVRTRELEPGQVAVEIQDTGCGMVPETLRRAFEPFFSTKAPGTGTGLGLPISRKLLDEMGGRIEIESTPGKGTLTRVVLPAARDEVAPPAPASGPGTVVAPPRRGRVLVVDDEEMVGTVLARALRGEHDVVVETSGRKAIARIASGERFDVVLCDLMMPEMSGMEVFREASKLQPRLAEEIVFMTGGAFTPEARAFLAGVPNAQIEKPFELLDLRRIVNARVRAAAGDHR